MKRAFVVDFDGTITKDDVGYLIIKNFAQNGWDRWENLWIEGKITTPMRAEMQWGMINSSPEGILDFIKDIDIRSDFYNFYKYVKEKGDRIIISSDGFDFYINPILGNNGLDDIEIRCCHLEYDNGWKFTYPNSLKGCAQCGNCSGEIVNNLRADGYEVVYIGDGYSDRCGCKNADIIFAKTFLSGYCKEEKINHIMFKSFLEIIEFLEG